MMNRNKTFRTTVKGALLASTMLVVPALGVSAQEQQEEALEDRTLEEVVVLGKFVPDEKRSTSEVSNILGPEDFALTGDSNIAGALKRVTGLSLVDGKFVFVRGLGGRYASALLDGASLPSPEPLRRIIPLDIFPTVLLGGALVQKTYSPQYPAEFGGGIIELRTKAVPDEQYIEIGVGGEYNTSTTFKKGLSYDGSGTDFLGFDSGKRSLPDIIRDTPELDGLTPEQLEAAGEGLANVWSIDSEPNAPNSSLEFTYGDRFDFSDNSLGVVMALRYSSDFQNKFGERNTFVDSDIGLLPNEALNPEVCDRFEGAGDGCGLRSSEWNVYLNGVFSVGMEFDNDNSVKYTTLLLRKSTREAIIEQGEFSADPGSLRSQQRIDWVEQQVWTNQVSGEHFFELLGDADPLNLNWYAAYSKANRDVKLRREYRYDYDDVAQVFRLSARADGNRTSYGDLTDDVIDIGFDFVQPVMVGDMLVDIKAGAAYLDKERESAFRRFTFDFPSGALLDLRQLIPEIVFGSTNVGPGGFELREATDPSDAFSSTLENIQFFGQVDAQVTPTFRLAGGLRYEDSEQFVDTINRATDEPVQTTLKGEFLLPAATATWEFYENMQVRLGFSQTLSRPDLRELSSANFLEPERDRLVRGNPFLQITEIDNYDLRWEWYFDEGESATVGVFYKEFTNPIERQLRAFGEGVIRTFDNAETAELIGIEAEVELVVPVYDWTEWSWTKNKDFYLKVNGAYIDSEITLSPDDQDLQTDTQRRLQGQSDVLLNAQFGYEDYNAGERASILFNYTGDRIDDVGLLGAPNLIEKPPVLIDLLYAREFDMWGGTYEVSFEAKNLLGDEFLLTQGGLVAETYELGRVFSLGLKARY